MSEFLASLLLLAAVLGIGLLLSLIMRRIERRVKSPPGDRCPVDALGRGMTPVEAAVWHVWGDRCSDFEPECLTCKAWADFDQIKRSECAKNERLRAALSADAQTLRLHLGEMSAQEMRTLKAGFAWVLSRAALAAQPAPGKEEA